MMDDLLQEMIDPAPAQGDRPRRRRLWATIAIVGLSALGVTSLTTGAIFSDDESSSSAITTGSIDLSLGDVTFSVPVDNMLPGASVVAPVEVNNDGSLRYQYGIVYEATDTGTQPLSSQLRMRIFDIPAGQCTLGNTQVGSPNRISPSDDTWGLATTPTSVVGDATVDAAPGNRELSAQTSEELCVRIDLNSSAGNAYQSQSTDLNLTFQARQLNFSAANPGESNN